MRARFFAIAFVALLGCSRKSPGQTLDENWTVVIPDAGVPLAPATSVASSSSSVDAAVAKADIDAGANDFEDQFSYGEYDAGKGDASALTKKPGFDSYANGRFGFSLDVPRALTPMPEPENGDGRQWRLGSLVSMTASGMNWVPEYGSAMCASSKNVVAHQESKSACFSTGKRDGFIFWERHVIAREIDFSLRFQYAESLKSAMDPIVTHVNASWSH
jgi:hypothetical protein